SVEDYKKEGIPEEWVPVLQKMGLSTIDLLKAANPNKVFNDLGGMRKKMKLEVAMPTKEEVNEWFKYPFVNSFHLQTLQTFLQRTQFRFGVCLFILFIINNFRFSILYKALVRKLGVNCL